MKLEDFLRENTNIEKNIINHIGQYHVIGTCGDCHFWENPDDEANKLDDEFGACQESDHIETSELETRKHFGCRNWKEKE